VCSPGPLRSHPAVLAPPPQAGEASRQSIAQRCLHSKPPRLGTSAYPRERASHLVPPPACGRGLEEGQGDRSTAVTVRTGHQVHRSAEASFQISGSVHENQSDEAEITPLSDVDLDADLRSDTDLTHVDAKQCETAKSGEARTPCSQGQFPANRQVGGVPRWLDQLCSGWEPEFPQVDAEPADIEG
jgi:hypothetical protein